MEEFYFCQLVNWGLQNTMSVYTCSHYKPVESKGVNGCISNKCVTLKTHQSFEAKYIVLSKLNF